MFVGKRFSVGRFISELMSGVARGFARLGKARSPASAWLARNPFPFYLALVAIWICGLLLARPLGSLAVESYLRASGIVQAFFLVGPPALVWTNLAQPVSRQVPTVFQHALSGFARTLASTFWVAVSVSLGFWIAQESDRGRSGLPGVLVATGVIVGGALLVRYALMVRYTLNSDDTQRAEVNEVISPASNTWGSYEYPSNVAWLRHHAWRMATSPFGAVVVLVSLALGLWAYFGAFSQ